jgi:hypothetical protein
MTDIVETIPGRNCSGCTMCCKLLDIPEINKPRLQWCADCAPGIGCQIYDKRPATCRSFYCGYLTNPVLSEDWKPSRSKLLVTLDDKLNRVAVHVDPARPDAWRQEPYYSIIKRWARTAVPAQVQVLVWIGRRVFAVLPHADKDLGEVRTDQVVLTSQTPTANGGVLDMIVVDYDDPRAVHVRRLGGQDGIP